MDHDKEMGSMRCNQCQATHQARITHLTEPIDMYHDWIDECEKVNS
eukprot:CAMPEP_0202901712 /NCGR_PEP_ID=MMETSP1392-20130828/14416_1 /ASSEMBLY_ACC=CAM_ASM_000868 /TAXON_ID=225041 /ORGANISM="Chlamydomonas chlamydogama, Strain SAG 11-48b" /LENGTH=45 /DNA_ID= /DNA_START= /DNA_END= /DNA_ORIENTATION=